MGEGIPLAPQPRNWAKQAKGKKGKTKRTELRLLNDCAGKWERWDCSAIRSRNRACSDRCCWRGWGRGEGA